MARRGEHTGGESAKTQGPSKDKADRKALAKQETAKRAALGAEAVKTPMPEAAPRPANPEHSQKAAPPESPIESVPAGVVAETPNAADTSAPAPAVASTADEERERAINAAFDHAKSSFEAAQQTGEGFRLKGTIATTIGTLKKRHGTEAVADLLQRLEREGVRDREEGASKPEESPKSEPTDIGSLENGIKEGEELPLLDLHYDQKKAKWVVVEKRTDAQGNESTHDAPSVYQDCVLEINDELGGDYLEDNAHRKTYVALLNQLKRELAGTRVSLITDRSGAGSVTAAYRDTERSEDIGTKKGSRISAQKTAVQHLRDSIVRDTAIPEIIENLGRGLTSEMNVYKSKARAAAWEHIKIGQGEGTIVVRGSVSFGGHTVELGDEHEYSIEFLARLAGKQPQALSGDEILAYAKAATLAALARDTRYAEAIKALQTVQEYNPRPADAAGASRAATPRGANRDADRQQPKPLVARTEGKVPAQVASKPPFEIGKTYTDIERLGFIDQEITKLNEEIRQLQKDGKKGSEDMANLARQQTALLLDKMDLQKKIAGLRKAATQGNTSAEEQAVEPPKPGPVPKPEAGAAATPSKPSSASAELSAEHGAALNDEQRKQLQKEYTDVQDNLVARRKKVADLEARGIRKKNEGTQLTYEKTQIARLEARRDALLKQLGFKTIEGTSREGGAEQPISEAERLALAEHMRIGLPLLARQGLRIIAEAVASARALTDKLQSYPENELGESRMEAIDNAIEIINTAEKERAEIAAFLDKTTDIAELRSLVGRSSEMALQSAAAAGRLEAFAKEMRGQASDESAAKVSEEAEQKLRAFYQEDPGGPHKSGLGIAFQKGEIIITHAVQGLGRGVLKKTTLSEADIRSALPDDLAVEIAETPLHKLKPELRAKVADAAADYFIKTMASGGFEKPAAPAAAGDTTTEAAGTHAKGSEGAEPEIGSVETHPNRMFVYFVFRAPDNTVTHSTLTLERPEILAALPEQIRDTIGDTPFNKLGQKTINEIKELITPLINAKIAEKIGLPTMTTTQAAESPQPVPAAGDEAAQGGDFMPEGTFDEGGHAPPDTLGQEESWVEQAKRQGFVCSGSSGYEDHVIANYYDLPPPHDGRGKLSIAVSQDQIMQVLPQDLQNKIAEEGGLFWADQNSEEQKTIFAAAEECAARKILRNMASEAAGLVEPPHPDLEGVNNTIDNLYSRAEDLFDADIMADLAFLGDIPPPNDEWARQLQDLRDRVATNQNMIAHWFDERDHVNTIQKTDAESTYILTRDCAQALAGWLEDREDLTFEIRRMANAQRETLPFLSPPASGGMNIDETAPFLGLEQAWTAPQTPGAPQLAVREPLQIGAGSETRQLTPQETARVQEIDQKVASLKARIAERDEQIRLIEEQIRALASQSNET